MKYKKYFRKTSLKQAGVGELFLNEINKKRPKTFLEIGVFHGVTARNVCELLHNIHGKEFKYIGLDLFEESDENKNEIIPKTKFSNPLKTIYFKYIKRQNPYSLVAVKELLNKFKDNIHLIKGNSNYILSKIDMKKIDYVSHNEVIKHQKTSKLLLLMVNNTPNAKGIITGKVFEYMASKRPILAIGPKDGDLGEILTKTSSGLVCDYDNVENLSSKIWRIFKDDMKFENNISSYSRVKLTEKLVNLLNEVIS